MRKKLQIFISSTFTDLQEERQAAVEAVLKAGHIPAGMELFRSGDESQKKTITKWIEESDAYLLILGGRYGAIEPTSGKSYTHWEYDLAGEIGIPRFAVVMSENALNIKVSQKGQSVLELENNHLYKDFKKQVLEKISHFFDDTKDIQFTVMQKMIELSNNNELKGWVSGKEIGDINELSTTIAALSKEVRTLQAENKRLSETNQIKIMQPPVNTLKDDIDDIDIDTRVENILNVLDAEEIKTGFIQWFESQVLDSNTEDDPDEEHVFIKGLPDGFTPYFVYSDDQQRYKKLLIVLLEDEDVNLASRISDLRLLVKGCGHAMWLPIEIVFAISGEYPTLENRIKNCLQTALEKEDVIDPSLFSISLWDKKKLKEIETDLGLLLEI